VDMSEFTRRIERGIIDPEELDRAKKWIRENCREGKDYNPGETRKTGEQKEKEWDFVARMALVARDLMVGNPKLRELGYGEEALGHNAIAAGFQGQRQWTDHFPNGDFMEAVLCSSFDWNGIRQPYILATENDSLNGVSMLFGHLLTGAAQVFSDVRTYWSPEAVKRVTGFRLEGEAGKGFIHLINSGPSALDGTGRQTIDGKPAMKPWYEISEQEAQLCLDHTTWGAAITEYFRGGGFSSTFDTKGGMPITMSRINIVRGLGPALQIAEGFTIDLPGDVHKALTERTNPTWPTTWFVPGLTGEGNFRDVYSVMASWGANHGAFTYGHIGAQLITLASMLRIPVSMHNVPGEKIFRPGAWSAFGMDKEGADYRACAAYGPLYR
jgi:L-fucose isomerase